MNATDNPVTRSRRWPPAVAGTAALVLALFVLPNPFKIPQNNPTASAEYAPVPGKSDEANNANFGETGLADSAGIGSGSQGEGIGAGSPPPPPPPQFRPRQKHCIGNPPRQTEDPLSPPCVPFFDGNNGGATYQGVTKDEVKVVFYNDRCCDEKDLTKPWKSSDEGPCVYAFECDHIVRTVKAMLRHFQSRYQTYGRLVRAVASKSTGDLNAKCATRHEDAQRDWDEHKPFAVVFMDVVAGNSKCYMDEMYKKKVLSFGIEWSLNPEDYVERAPYGWGFFPDQRTKTDWSASFICRTLEGGKARFTDDPLLKDKPRKFGFIRPKTETRGPEVIEQAEMLEQAVKRMCGLEMFERIYADGGAADAGPIMSAMKAEGVTTVVCYCIPAMTENTTPSMEKAATSINYYPEWYFDSNERNSEPAWIKLLGSPEHTRFGSTMYWRQPSFKEQAFWRAYQAEEPGTQPNLRFGFDVYHLFLNLFQGIQGAGPHLTPQSVERGMFTFHYQKHTLNMPIGGYGPYSQKAVSDYTFLDSAMGWWWDPNGRPPGGRPNEGCLRVMNQGKRYFTGEWPKGDADLMLESDPCSEDVRKIEDSAAG